MDGTQAGESEGKEALATMGPGDPERCVGCCSTLIREVSTRSEWQLTQRSTADQCQEPGMFSPK